MPSRQRELVPLREILSRLIERIDVGLGPVLVVRDHINEGRGARLLVQTLRVRQHETPAPEASVVLGLGRIAAHLLVKEPPQLRHDVQNELVKDDRTQQRPLDELAILEEDVLLEIDEKVPCSVSSVVPATSPS